MADTDGWQGWANPFAGRAMTAGHSWPNLFATRGVTSTPLWPSALPGVGYSPRGIVTPFGVPVGGWDFGAGGVSAGELGQLPQWSIPGHQDWTLMYQSSYAPDFAAALGTVATEEQPWFNVGASNVTRMLRSAPRETAPAIEVTAEWDGYVEKISKDHFVARMRGLKGKGVEGSDEEAEIPMSLVDAADLDLVVPGGFFRLIVTDEKPKVGPKRSYTSVQFRRLPAYTKRDLDAAEREADEILNAFRLASGGQATGA